MTSEALYKLRFPIGSFHTPESISKAMITTWINEIEAFPKAVAAITEHLSVDQLNWIYRPDGWTIKQVVHHCADSHMNCIIRFKLALTENTPTIRPYYENRWAELSDGTYNDLTDTLSLLHGLHAKLGRLMRQLSDEDLKREFIHPEHGKRFRLDETIGIYAWHSNHHLAHIKQAIVYKGAFKM